MLAGDCTNIEQQNSLHLTQMKTLLDGHLVQQRNILNEFKDEYKTIHKEIINLKEDIVSDRKVLQKALNHHKDEIGRISSYKDGVCMSRRVYNWCLGIFIVVVTTIAVGLLLMISNWLAQT
jgi:hypothetical protein